jgi:putative tryptophan/tyrosine transport system substrate-binding protein
VDSAIDPLSGRFIKSSQAAAEALGISARPLETSTSDAIEQAFSAVCSGRRGWEIIGPGSKFFIERALIVSSSLEHKLPTLTPVGEMVPDRILMSHSQDFHAVYRKATTYVDKILKGAKPADLPVEQPTTFKLVINMKTAKILGLTIPRRYPSLPTR